MNRFLAVAFAVAGAMVAFFLIADSRLRASQPDLGIWCRR
mgnify:CR=1 FL=1